MALFLVGTRFQATMSLAIIQYENIESFHLMLVGRPADQVRCQDNALDELIGLATATTRVSFREEPARAARALLVLAMYELLADRKVFTAAITNPAIMYVFRVLPFLECCTFDEGQYNIRNTSPLANERKANRHWLTRLLFWRGILDYSRNRTVRHYSAFEPSLNLFAERAVQVQINWETLLSKDDLALSSRSIKSVFALPCIPDLNLSLPEKDRLLSVARTCDIAIRHPRDPSLELANAVSLSSPAEGFLASLARLRPVLVLHYGSTIAYTLSGFSNIELVDISVEK